MVEVLVRKRKLVRKREVVEMENAATSSVGGSKRRRKCAGGMNEGMEQGGGWCILSDMARVGAGAEKKTCVADKLDGLAHDRLTWGERGGDEGDLLNGRQNEKPSVDSSWSCTLFDDVLVDILGEINTSGIAFGSREEYLMSRESEVEQKAKEDGERKVILKLKEARSQSLFERMLEELEEINGEMGKREAFLAGCGLVRPGVAEVLRNRRIEKAKEVERARARRICATRLRPNPRRKQFVDMISPNSERRKALSRSMGGERHLSVRDGNVRAAVKKLVQAKSEASSMVPGRLLGDEESMKKRMMMKKRRRRRRRRSRCGCGDKATGGVASCLLMNGNGVEGGSGGGSACAGVDAGEVVLISMKKEERPNNTELRVTDGKETLQASCVSGGDAVACGVGGGVEMKGKCWRNNENVSILQRIANELVNITCRGVVWSLVDEELKCAEIMRGGRVIKEEEEEANEVQPTLDVKRPSYRRRSSRKLIRKVYTGSRVVPKILKKSHSKISEELRPCGNGHLSIATLGLAKSAKWSTSGGDGESERIASRWKPLVIRAAMTPGSALVSVEM